MPENHHDKWNKLLQIAVKRTFWGTTGGVIVIIASVLRKKRHFLCYFLPAFFPSCFPPFPLSPPLFSSSFLPCTPSPSITLFLYFCLLFLLFSFSSLSFFSHKHTFTLQTLLSVLELELQNIFWPYFCHIKFLSGDKSRK